MFITVYSLQFYKYERIDTVLDNLFVFCEILCEAVKVGSLHNSHVHGPCLYTGNF